MEFLKRNLFNLILVVMTVLLSVAVYFMLIAPTAEKNKKEVVERESYNSRIRSLKSGGVNEQMVSDEREKVKRIKDSFGNLQKTLDKMNRAMREPLVVKIPNKNVEFPAFPVDPEKYREHQVQFLFPRIYRDAMDALFDSLNAAGPLEDFEVEHATEKMYNYLVQQELDSADSSGLIADLPAGLDDSLGAGEFTEKSTRRTSTPSAAAPMAPPGAGAFGGATDPFAMGAPTPGIPTRSRTSRRTNSMTNTPVEQNTVTVDRNKAQELAVNNLYVQKAESEHRPIYAVKEQAFQYYPLPDNVMSEIDDMWKANVNYWIHQYVVDSIKKANEKVAQRINQPVTISTATVKRLVSVNIGTGGRSSGGLGMSQKSSMMYVGESSPSSNQYSSSTQKPDGLTGRVCTAQYDVVNFELAVIIAANRLLEFQEVLVGSDFYTIQKVDLYDPYLQDETARSVSGVSEDKFYYGPEPVIKAVFQIESLMFTEWERELMPIEMLKRLPQSALRPEDSKRINEQAGGSSGSSNSQNPYNMY